MSKKHNDETPPWLTELHEMKYSDLKKACIIRGLSHEIISEGDYSVLSNFFIKYYNKEVDLTLIEKFDQDRDKVLEAIGYEESDPMRKFKLSQIILQEEDLEKIEKKKKEKIKKIVESKPKREINQETQIVKGTKKDLTYQLAKKDPPLPKDKIIQKVLKEFPDANEKSIGIWISRCRNNG